MKVKKNKLDKTSSIAEIIDKEKWRLNEETEKEVANAFGRLISVNSWHEMHNESLERIKTQLKKLKDNKK